MTTTDPRTRQALLTELRRVCQGRGPVTQVMQIAVARWRETHDEPLRAATDLAGLRALIDHMQSVPILVREPVIALDPDDLAVRAAECCDVETLDGMITRVRADKILAARDVRQALGPDTVRYARVVRGHEPVRLETWLLRCRTEVTVKARSLSRGVQVWVG